ncbi:SGF29 tudor-like domain-containing protein [Gigaspora rosea]|uniref:SGF29 tudor-like domain-containing protein n=1 Tax=Gigaspora rosea TaxID=44941 RepID=A0A397W8T1_9GLOM|nr:SGF29 tudor-like domain-containing protein [Gigaspora rosea]
MDKYLGETSRQSLEEDILWNRICENLDSLERIEEEGIDLIKSINEYHEKIQCDGYVAPDVKGILKALYKKAIDQAVREEDMCKTITKLIDKYHALKSDKDFRTHSEGLSAEENIYKKKKSKDAATLMKKSKGSHSKSRNIIKNGTYVAAKQPKHKDIEENWILAIVVGYISEIKSYEVEDADRDEASNRPGERFSVPSKNVIIIPKPGEMWMPEFPQSSTVIALYPGTTCFYKADVVLPPSKLSLPLKYLLTFEDDDNAERYVDAHYVLDVPKETK